MIITKGSLLLLLSSLIAIAIKPQSSIKLQETVPLTISQDLSILKGSHDALRDHQATLVGKHKLQRGPQGQKIIQLVWIGIANQKYDVSLFDEPFVTSFKTDKNELTKGLTVPFTGDIKQLEQALAKLQSGQRNDIKNINNIKNQLSTSRRVNQDDANNTDQYGANRQNSVNIDPNGNNTNGSQNNLSNDAINGNGSTINDQNYSQNQAKITDSSVQTKSARSANSSNSYANRGTEYISQPSMQPDFSTGQSSGNHRTKSKKDKQKPTYSSPQMTYEACLPRIDEVQKKVVMQNKSITKQHGKEDIIGICQDSLESYLIHKDYDAPECTDLIKMDQRKAWSRYKKYWINGAGQRFDISDRLYVDENRAHPFIEERGHCKARIDLNSMQAYAQLETVYYGRSHKRIVIHPCHDDTKAKPCPITLTSQGCEVQHDFTKNVSKEFKRAIFTLDHSLHEARSCYEQDSILSHQFDTAKPCHAVKNFETQQLIKMGRRYVELSNGKRQYLSNVCEPTGLVHGIKFTTEGCSGYEHNYSLDKAYPKGHWYADKGRISKKFITSCAPGPISYNHILDIMGYHYVDHQQFCYPIHKISIKDPNHKDQLTVIKAHKIRFDLSPHPYKFIEEVIKENPHKSSRYEGCYKFYPLAKMKIFERPDGSFYQQFIEGKGERRSKDLCKRIKEFKTEYEYIVDIGKWSTQTSEGFDCGKGWHSKYNIFVNTLMLDKTVNLLKSSNDYQFTQKEVGPDACIYMRAKYYQRIQIIFPQGNVEFTDWSINKEDKIKASQRIKKGVSISNPSHMIMPGASFDENEYREHDEWTGIYTNRYCYSNNMPNRVN